MQASQSTTPSHTQIEQIARSLWQQAGQPQNRDLEFWLKAEQKIKASPNTQSADPNDGTQRAKASSLQVLNSPASKPARREKKAA
jgi:Protein of unknown function (DUF2934)